MSRSYSEVLPLAQQLRSIGQALEARRLQNFELEVDEYDFVVRGQTSPRVEEAGTQEQRETSAGTLSRLFGRAAPKQAEAAPPAAHDPAPMELRFTPEEVNRLDGEGRARRQSSGGMPEFGSAQLLRTIGDYLDRQGHSLRRVEKQGPTINVEYENASGQMNTENRTNSSLYDLSVRMYLRRSER